ncbi:MAG: DUF4160 domain-containing protein [Candidatus Hydrogenedentes bacterium]|nr:DUF4160 domain-containing protein [Candidatus Hydrogenedentota bacterium]
MSPTVFRFGEYRFFFFSREEDRPHVHVTCPEGEGKFWLEPDVEVAKSYGLTEQQITAVIRIIEERKNEISAAWGRHFGR